MTRKTLISIYTLPLLVTVILYLLLSAVSPTDAGPGGILIVFILVYVFFTSLLFTLLHLGLRSLNSFLSQKKQGRLSTLTPLSVRRSYYMASVLAFGPVLLLALNSVRQLRVQDVVLVVLFLILAIFYIAKRD